MTGQAGTLQHHHEQFSFTAAEARVLPFLASHLTLEGIANRLGIRRSTVKTHVVSIYKKLGATTRAQAVERAVAKGFLNDTVGGPIVRVVPNQVDQPWNRS